jgi:uncharacterized protein YjbI with pentapeptide repeats
MAGPRTNRGVPRFRPVAGADKRTALPERADHLGATCLALCRSRRVTWFFYRNPLQAPESQRKRVVARVRHSASALWVRVTVVAGLIYRNALGSFGPRGEGMRGAIGRWAHLLWLPIALIVLNLVYLNVGPADADPNLVRYQEALPRQPLLARIRRYVDGALRQPVDVLLCYSLGWGCRYLVVDHRTVVGQVWAPHVIADLRAEPQGHLKKLLAAIEGVFLRDRVLRFANLDESRLYAADLISADLSGATLSGTQMQGARASGAVLAGASLENVDLSGAEMNVANLSGANISNANLSGVDLTAATLSGANLFAAKLLGANLTVAELPEANLFGAKLSGAKLTRANLTRANLDHARLSGADPTETRVNQGQLVLNCVEMR